MSGEEQHVLTGTPTKIAASTAGIFESAEHVYKDFGLLVPAGGFRIFAIFLIPWGYN